MMFRLTLWVMGRTPLRIAWAVAWVMAWLWWVVVPVRRDRAIANFKHVFPERPPGPPLRRMIADLILGYFELVREVRRPGSIRMEFNRDDPVFDRMRAEHEAGRGMVILLGHLGSWDFCVPALGRDCGLPCTAIVKTPAQPQVAAWVEKARYSFQVDMLPDARSMDRIYQQLEEGRVLGFFLDQRLNRGIPVEFFGRPAWTSPAVARLVEKQGTLVFAGRCWRGGIGHHCAHIEGPLELSGEIEADTQRLQHWYEEAIRKNPHGWLWLHDRWKVPR